MSNRPLIDGEYDPRAAADSRAAHAQRVRLDRQKRLDTAKAKKDAAVKQQKIIDSYKRMGAIRTAELKAAEAKAAKKLPAPSKFKGIPGPAAGPTPGSLGAQIQAGLSATISNIMKVASKRVKPITDAGLKSQEGISGALNYWAAKNDQLYEKGNFMTPAEKAEVLTEVQKNPFLAYDIMTGTKPEKPPKTFDEAINRMNYMVSEMALGGAREVALPFSMKAGMPRRTEDALLQIVGGLITPSPADLLVSTAFRALASVGKKGTSIMRKALKGTALASDEALQFEKLIGQYGYSTSDIRKAGTKLNKLSNAEWDEMLKGYQNYYDFWKKNPELYGAGAAYKPSALLQFEDLLDDLGYEAGEYIDFLKANKVGPTFNPATLAAFASGLKPPTPDLKAFDKIESDLEKFRESQEKMLKQVQKVEPVLIGPIAKGKPKPKELLEPGYTPPTEVQEEEEDIATLPGYTPPIEEEEQVTEPVTLPGEPAPPEPPKPEEPKPTVPEEEVPLVPRKGKDGKMPRNIFRALVGGKSEEYRVQFEYPRSKTESFTVKARSFPQALGQAQGLRRVRKSPSEVDIVQMEEKK